MRSEQLEVKRGKKMGGGRKKDRCTQRKQKYGEGSQSRRTTWIYFLWSFQ
jgi:hypothetical protein